MDASAFLESQDAWILADQLPHSPEFSFGDFHQEFVAVDDPYGLLTSQSFSESQGATHASALPPQNDEGFKSMDAASAAETLLNDDLCENFFNDMMKGWAMEESFNERLSTWYNELHDVLSDSSMSFPSSRSSNETNSDNSSSLDVMSFLSTEPHHQHDKPFICGQSSSDNVHSSVRLPVSNKMSWRGESKFFDEAESAEFIPRDNLEAANSQNKGSQFSEAGPADKNASFVKNRDLDPEANSQYQKSEFSEGEPSNKNVSFEKNRELEVEADYERLYLNKVQTTKANAAVDDKLDGREVDKNQNKHAASKRSRAAAKRNQKNAQAATMASIKQNVFETGLALDLKESLVSCAQAVAVGNVTRAVETLQQLKRDGASLSGNGLQRVIYYFCEALEARISGTGVHAYLNAAYVNRPPPSLLRTVFKVVFKLAPMRTLSHYFANQNILKAAEGATRLHIIDYGIFYGLQWPCLIKALADRKGGPPTLVITGIDFEQRGSNPAEGLDDIGMRLKEYAREYNVPFEYHAMAENQWDNVDPSVHITHDRQEVLIANCMSGLQRVPDESLVYSEEDKSTSCPRQRVLENICKLNPDLFVIGVVNASHSSPFFVPRFREALNYFCCKIDMLETTWDNSDERMILEKKCLYHDVLNVVACEGLERVERPETFKQWQARIQRAGFEQLPIIPSIFARSRAHVRSFYHKDFNVDHDSNRWMLMGWKGRTMGAVSSWRPSCM